MEYNDEEADRIIRILKTHPKPRRFIEDEILYELSEEIAKKIDKEILEKLRDNDYE